MVFVFHHLTQFTQHNALQFHPCCCKGQELLVSFCCIVFHCVNMCSSLIHSFTDGHLGCFQHLAIINCAAMNIFYVRIIAQTLCQNFQVFQKLPLTIPVFILNPEYLPLAYLFSDPCWTKTLILRVPVLPNPFQREAYE